MVIANSIGPKVLVGENNTFNTRKLGAQAPLGSCDYSTGHKMDAPRGVHQMNWIWLGSNAFAHFDVRSMDVPRVHLFIF